MYSEIALKIYAAVSENIIKSNFQFWKNFYDVNKINELNVDTQKYRKLLDKTNYNIICCFDENFPKITANIKLCEKPFLFAYSGNINLLSDAQNNIAVIGVLNPDEDIVQREAQIIKKITLNKMNIVSGLATGCDTIAHENCLIYGGKTIAFLPTTLDNVYPAKNKELANNIVKHDGLIVTEYIKNANSRSETIKRFIERDRLQAMFANAIILIASFRKGEGDSGSRHAMEKARQYGIQRFVVYNIKTDKHKSIFGLNEDLLKENDLKILTEKILAKLVNKNDADS